MLKDLPPLQNVFDSVKAEGFLGNGSNASVYRVSGYSEYALRLEKGVGNLSDVLQEAETIDDSVFQGRNFGQAVAQYGKGVTLLHFQGGISPGVPAHLRYDKSRTEEENDSLYEEKTKIAAEMPVSAYVGLLEDLRFLESIDKRVDPSKANNMLIDVKESRFKLVDILSKNAGSDYRNHPQEFVVMLFDNSYAWKYKGAQEESLQEHRKIIIDKMVQAAETVGIKFVKNEAEKDPSFSYSLTLAGYEKGSPERAAIVKRIDAITEGKFSPDNVSQTSVSQSLDATY